jgi:calcineurin-like phosphoesterase family protein
MTYWITTDTHFGHDAIVEYCGRPHNFEDVIIRKHNDAISLGDVLIHLGDVSLYNEDYWNRRFTAIGASKFWLAKGNHDKRSDKWYLERGWDFVAKRIYLARYGKLIALSHEPVLDGFFDFNIHGHFHNAEHRKTKDVRPGLTYRHKLVALEYTNYRPVSLRSIINL